MPEDWYHVAYINFTKAILHGHRKDQSEVERVLTKEECRRVEDLNTSHEIAMQNLLRELAGQP